MGKIDSYGYGSSSVPFVLNSTLVHPADTASRGLETCHGNDPQDVSGKRAVFGGVGSQLV
jgi:hypothetical protein